MQPTNLFLAFNLWPGIHMQMVARMLFYQAGRHRLLPFLVHFPQRPWKTLPTRYADTPLHLLDLATYSVWLELGTCIGSTSDDGPRWNSVTGVSQGPGTGLL